MGLWIIDAGYLFRAQRCMGPEYRFDYLKLRQDLESELGPNFARSGATRPMVRSGNSSLGTPLIRVRS